MNWNIDGITDKFDNQTFIDEVSKHDICIFCETWAEDNNITPPPGYTYINAFRSKKHKKAKRGSGGVLVLVKKNIQKYISKVAVIKEHFIWIKISKSLTGHTYDTYCCGGYIPPQYSSFYTNNDIDLIQELDKSIIRFSSLGHILITGDLNARTGTRSDIAQFDEKDHGELFSESSTKINIRNSRDKVVNTWGRKLLEICDNHNMCIVNGRTVGDFQGKFTFYSTLGNSVYDVTVVDIDYLPKILSFIVHPPNEFSHHCKIETKLSCLHRETHQTSDDCLIKEQFNKFIWEGDISKSKLLEATSTATFMQKKETFMSLDYDTSSKSVKKATEDIEHLLTDLHMKSCKMKRANKQKKRSNNRMYQPWYSEQCETLRNKIRRSGEEASKDPFNRKKQAELATAKREYNRLIRRLKREHRKAVISELETLDSENNSDFWPLLQKLRKKKNSISSVDMDELLSHFKSLLDKPESPLSDEQKHRKEEVEKFIKADKSLLDPTLRRKYTATDIVTLCSTLKNGKSAYKDGTLNEVLKHAKSPLAPILAKLFNLIEASGYFPNSWNCNFLVPLLKKGDPSCASNYRGIAIGSNLCKLYTKAFNRKITSFCDQNSILSPYQFGFRTDHRTTDSVFVLKSVLSHYKAMGNKPVYSCFIDLSKAFDSINRTDLLYKLGKYGIQGNILQVIQSMYSDISYSIKSNGKYSTPFKSSLGVKQGCNLGPLLFNLFINDIHDSFDSACKPVKMDQQTFNTIAFADDIVVLSETPEGLQNSLDNIQAYCKQWGLQINCDKTKVVEFNRPYRKLRPRTYTVSEEHIEVCKKFCYLGVEITSTGSFHCTMERACLKPRKALYSLYSSLNIYNDEGNIPLFIKLFKILIKPILSYGSEVWGYQCTKTGTPISKFINRFYKTLLGVPTHTSTAAIHLELDCDPIETDMKKNLLKYWHRIIHLPNTRLVRQCYNALLADGAKDQFTAAIKNVLFENNLESTWTNQ